jgi:hypothetical protein
MDHDDDDPLGFREEKTDPGFPARLGEREPARGLLRQSDAPPIERTNPNFLIGDVLQKVPSAAPPAAAAEESRSAVRAFLDAEQGGEASGVHARKDDDVPSPEPGLRLEDGAGVDRTPARGFARNQVGEADRRSRVPMSIGIAALVVGALVVMAWVASSGRHAETEPPKAAAPATTSAPPPPPPVATAEPPPVVTATAAPKAVASAPAKVPAVAAVKAPAKAVKAAKETKPKDILDTVEPKEPKETKGAKEPKEPKEPAEAPLPNFPVPASPPTATAAPPPAATSLPSLPPSE